MVLRQQFFDSEIEKRDLKKRKTSITAKSKKTLFKQYSLLDKEFVLNNKRGESPTKVLPDRLNEKETKSPSRLGKPHELQIKEQQSTSHMLTEQGRIEYLRKKQEKIERKRDNQFRRILNGQPKKYKGTVQTTEDNSQTLETSREKKKKVPLVSPDRIREQNYK